MLSVPATSDWRNNPPLRACDPTQQGPPMGICAPRTRLPTACSGTALQRTVPLPLRVSVSHALKLFDSLLDVHYQTPPPRPSPPLLRKLETSAASVCTSRPSPPHRYLSFCSNSYVDTHVAADAFAGTVRIDEDARAAQLCPERQRSAALAGTSIICNISSTYLQYILLYFSASIDTYLPASSCPSSSSTSSVRRALLLSSRRSPRRRSASRNPKT